MGSKRLVGLVAAVILVAGAGAASAQIREGRSEGYFLFQATGGMSGEWAKHSDVTLKFDSVNLWGFGGGYNPNEMVGFDFDLLFGNGYIEATGPAGTGAGNSVTLTQGISYFNGRLNANFYPVEGRFTPLLTGGIGFTNTVTKVPGAPPIYTCGGYYYWYCGYSYPSINNTAFTYNAGVGLRYDPPNSNFFLKLVYSWGWVDTNATKSTPHSEGAYVTLGGKF